MPGAANERIGHQPSGALQIVAIGVSEGAGGGRVCVAGLGGAGGRVAPSVGDWRGPLCAPIEDEGCSGSAPLESCATAKAAAKARIIAGTRVMSR